MPIDANRLLSSLTVGEVRELFDELADAIAQAPERQRWSDLRARIAAAPFTDEERARANRHVDGWQRRGRFPSYATRRDQPQHSFNVFEAIEKAFDRGNLPSESSLPS